MRRLDEGGDRWDAAVYTTSGPRLLEHLTYGELIQAVNGEVRRSTVQRIVLVPSPLNGNGRPCQGGAAVPEHRM